MSCGVEGAELSVRFFHEEGDGAEAWRGSDKAHGEHKYWKPPKTPCQQYQHLAPTFHENEELSGDPAAYRMVIIESGTMSAKAFLQTIECL
jgi:hypothetical protein